MRQLADSPPADFVSVNSAAFTDLQVAQASFTAGTMKTTGSTAQEPVTERLTLKGLGTVTLGLPCTWSSARGTGWWPGPRRRSRRRSGSATGSR